MCDRIDDKKSSYKIGIFQKTGFGENGKDRNSEKERIPVDQSSNRHFRPVYTEGEE
jgi:hypothetical protein